MGKEQRAMPAYEIPPALPGDVYYSNFSGHCGGRNSARQTNDTKPPLAVQAGVIIFE
jgi:hypothetical protein